MGLRVLSVAGESVIKRFRSNIADREGMKGIESKLLQNLVYLLTWSVFFKIISNHIRPGR